MEAIFTNSLGSPSNRWTDDDYENMVKLRIEDAIDYEQSYLALTREDNMEYYLGLKPYLVTETEDGEKVNRSTIISTDVRDTILSVLPSLVRIFTGSEHVVEFCANSEASADQAKSQTEYINYTFMEDNNGFLLLHDIFKDTLTVKIGIAQVWTDTEYEVVEQSYRNLTHEQLQYLVFEAQQAKKEVEPLEIEFDETTGLIRFCTLKFTVSKPLHKAEAVPPEEFRIDRKARNIQSARLIGREQFLAPSEIVKKGYDPEFVHEFITSGAVWYSDERYLRNPGLTEVTHLDDGVLWGEYYIRIDKDGDGIDELRCIKTIGDNHAIVEDYVVADHCFAVFCGDPRPHTVIGDCLADLTKDIQKIKTNLLRANLDNLAESVNPKTVINELLTNVEDALNDEVGAVIRTRGDPNTAVAFAKIPYVGDQIQPTVDYMDKVRTSRTGISEASKGLDPKVLQSTALTGIDAIISGAQERIELIARILAETGFKRLFQLLLKEVVNNPNPTRQLQINGKWKTFDPSTFDPNLRVRVNPTLGKGTDMMRLMILREIKATQELVMTKYGISNPFVTPEEYRNTLDDILSLSNVKNVSRYFKEITPETMQMIMNQPKEPDPAEVLANAEMEKIKKDIVLALRKAAQEDRKLDFQEQKLKMDDDFRRDKLNVDAAVDIVAALKSITDAQAKPQQELMNLNKEGS